MITKWVIFKYMVTAAVVVVVSEFAKSSDKLSGLIVALPFVTLLTLIQLIENQASGKIANHDYVRGLKLLSIDLL